MLPISEEMIKVNSSQRKGTQQHIISVSIAKILENHIVSKVSDVLFMRSYTIRLDVAWHNRMGSPTVKGYGPGVGASECSHDLSNPALPRTSDMLFLPRLINQKRIPYIEIKIYINFKFQCSQSCPFLSISVMFSVLPWQSGVVATETT